MSEYQTVAEGRIDTLLTTYDVMGLLPGRLSDEWKANAVQKADWLRREYENDIVVPFAHVPTIGVDDTRKKLSIIAASGVFPDDIATKLERTSAQLRDYEKMLVIPRSGLARGAIRGVLLMNDEVMTDERRPGADPMGLLDVVAVAAVARQLGYDGAMDLLSRAYTVHNDMTTTTRFGAATVRSPLQRPEARMMYSQLPRKPKPDGWLAWLLSER